MSDRAELIEILHQEATADRVKNSPLRDVPVVAAKLAASADAILAAGYRRPRVVTTVAELDALPGGSIVRDSRGFAWQKYNRPISDQPAWFAATRDDGFYFSSNFIDGNRAPLTVLHEPEADQ